MGRGGASAAAPAPKTEFYWSAEDEPHASRRREILKKYPQVSKLMGPEWRTKWIVAFLVTLQVSLSVVLRGVSWPVWLVTTYIVGATITHALLLAIHELAHNLGAKRPEVNRLIAFAANLPIVVPFSVSFKQYHVDHHKHQGVDGVDTDIPARAEAWFFQGRLRKALWCSIQIFFYAVRPIFVKRQPLTALIVLNVAVQVLFNAGLVYHFGWPSLGYLLTCLIMAGSIHPTAGHFIAEHYVFTRGQETYSYYGPMNVLAFNVGYHNEHHDFPYIPWSRLPALRAMAPEFYDDFAAYDSWCGVIWDFIMRSDMGPYSRVKRTAAPAKYE